jgi:hypothetical protein
MNLVDERRIRSLDETSVGDTMLDMDVHPGGRRPTNYAEHEIARGTVSSDNEDR